MKSKVIPNNIDSFPEGPLPAGLPKLLLAWYDRERRILPWREDPTPYHVWISEIMLQQTRVDTVIPYYKRFLRELPDVNALAEVPEDRLLKLWEGLGYYSRVRNMQKAARQIRDDFDGKIPSAPSALVKLSGIGTYTAAAIASMAFQIPAVAVDGNLLRVFARLSLYREDIGTPAAKHLAEAAYLEIFPKDRPGDMNQALMDLGATVCLPNGAPLCEKCPLSGICLAHREGCELTVPKPREKKSRPVRECTVLVIRSGERVLLHKRPKKGLLAGLYEFPNADGHLTEKEVRRLAETFMLSSASAAGPDLRVPSGPAASSGFTVPSGPAVSSGFTVPSGPAANSGLTVKAVRQLPNSRHIFTHLVWEMRGYEIELETAPPEGSNDRILFSNEAVLPEDYIFVSIEQLKNEAALPSAFSMYI